MQGRWRQCILLLPPKDPDCSKDSVPPESNTRMTKKPALSTRMRPLHDKIYMLMAYGWLYRFGDIHQQVFFLFRKSFTE